MFMRRRVGPVRPRDVTSNLVATGPIGYRRGVAGPALIWLLACAGVLSVVGGCTAESPERGSAATVESGDSALPSPTPGCPPAGEGTCLGDLTSGQIYQSSSFQPQVAFSVPAEGWVNAEDYPGNFSLLAPGGTIAGINAQTSDYIGIATAIAPSELAKAHGCVFQTLPGRWSTPQQVAGYFTDDPTLNSSQPHPVTVGGLRGVVLDIRTRPHVHLASCTVGGQRFRFGGSFSGVDPTQLDHAVIPGETIRLYLLAHDGAVLLVEANDVDAAPGDMASLEAVVRDLQFDHRP